MTVTSQGNSTLIRWGIFPAGPDNAMSNATAMVASTLEPTKNYLSITFFHRLICCVDLCQGIIYRLTQHHVQLPKNLGSYQLLEWNVQPLTRR
jgi:hypothetical protein